MKSKPENKMKQTQRVGVSGSVMNQIMGNNSTTPKVGEGATKLMYSDRQAYTVVFVSEDGKTVHIRRCRAIRTDSNGAHTESQDYRYEEMPEAKVTVLRYRNGAWRVVVKEVHYINYDSLTEEQKQSAANRDDAYRTLKLIDGITKEVTRFYKISILFGVRKEYYDPCF